MFNQVKCETPDLAKQNLEKLKALFPGVVTEGPDGVAIDVEALKQECSATPIEGNVERYEFTWPGKRAAKAAASTATKKTLRPCREESVNFDTTENLYIEGDNLEVLKLLQTNYAGKVKMIYIDPPYNTGHDFVYRDTFSLTDREIIARGDQCDDDGRWNIEHPDTNEASAARYHSNWCSMMYPRLKLARQLLDDDGVIFVSIDDNEVINVRKMLDELFGENKFVATFPRLATKSGKTPLTFMISHDYVICYVKSKMDIFTGSPYEDESYKYSDEYVETRGKYNVKQPLDCNSIGYSASLDYPIEYKGICYYPGSDKEKYEERKQGKHSEKDWAWRWSKELFEFGLDNGWIVFQNGRVYTKGYLNAAIEKIGTKYVVVERQKMRKMSTIDFIDNTYSNDIAKKHIASLGLAGLFDYPKAVSFVSKLLQSHYDKDCLMVDFFSGSGTTAEAVMSINAADRGARKYIVVQLPEIYGNESEAAKVGYKTICDVAKERIRRAGKKIAEENATTAPNLDIGFRVLKLDSSSLEDASETASGTKQQMLGLSRIKEDRTSEDLLFQILLESKLSLSDRIEKKNVEGNEVFFVSDTALVACLDAKAKMTEKFFTALAKFQPALAFFRDDLFESDSARINLAQIFKQFSPNTTITVI